MVSLEGQGTMIIGAKGAHNRHRNGHSINFPGKGVQISQENASTVSCITLLIIMFTIYYECPDFLQNKVLMNKSSIFNR